MNVLAYVHLRNIVGSTGAGRVARQMTESLARISGVDLRVLADPADHRRVIGEAGRPWTDYRYHFFENETSRQQARWFFLRGPNAESYWPQTEIAYCTAESYVPVKRARLAVTLHDAAYFEAEAHRGNFNFWKTRLKWKLLYGALDRNADMFHTVSAYSAERLSHFFPSIRQRLRVVPNAVTERFFAPASPDGESEMRAAGLAGERFILLPGGLHHRKNADLVLEAWPRLRELQPGLRLVVANHSDPFYSAGARAQEGIQLTGFVSEEMLVSLYHAAEVVWFPSRYEGFGMPVVEAMACGTPVVASNSSALPEVAGGAALLAGADDVDAHLAAIESLLNSAAERQRWADRGRARAAEFTWERSARKLHHEFQGIL
jgi:glycosyltransferase involved in cell wall biosynthesis